VVKKLIKILAFMLIPGVDPIHGPHPFKCKLRLGTTNQGTAYNSRMPIIGKLHVSTVDNQIRPILLCSMSEIPIPIHKVGIEKAWCQRKA